MGSINGLNFIVVLRIDQNDSCRFSFLGHPPIEIRLQGDVYLPLSFQGTVNPSMADIAKEVMLGTGRYLLDVNRELFLLGGCHMRP